MFKILCNLFNVVSPISNAQFKLMCKCNKHSALMQHFHQYLYIFVFLIFME